MIIFHFFFCSFLFPFYIPVFFFFFFFLTCFVNINIFFHCLQTITISSLLQLFTSHFLQLPFKFMSFLLNSLSTVFPLCSHTSTPTHRSHHPLCLSHPPIHTHIHTSTHVVTIIRYVFPIHLFTPTSTHPHTSLPSSVMSFHPQSSAAPRGRGCPHTPSAAPSAPRRARHSHSRWGR